MMLILFARSLLELGLAIGPRCRRAPHAPIDLGGMAAEWAAS